MKSLVVLFKLSKLYGRKFDFSGIPKYIIVGNVPFHMVFLCRSCFPVLIVNLSILKHFNNDDFSSFRVNWNIFVFKLLHIHTKQIFPIQFKLDTFCLSAEQNRTNRIDWVRLVWLSSAIELTNSRFRLIELTEKVQFDNVPLPNQSNSNPTDWVRLSSMDFWFGFVRLFTPGCIHRLQLKSVCPLQASSKFISTKFLQFHELT